MAKQSLEQRISAALKSNGEANRDTLFALWEEAFAEINRLNETIATEEPRLLDINNDDPDASRELIASSKLHIERLSKAITEELKPSVRALDAKKAQADWTAEADQIRDENDKLFAELKAMYPPFLQQILDLYFRILKNHSAFANHKVHAPAGADTSFSRIEPHSRFWLDMALSSWNNPGVKYPERQSPEQIAWAQQVAFTTALCEQTKAIEAKHAHMHSADWGAVYDEIHKRKAAEDEKAEQALKEKDQAARDEYYKSVLEAERRHVRGEI